MDASSPIFSSPDLFSHGSTGCDVDFFEPFSSSSHRVRGVHSAWKATSYFVSTCRDYDVEADSPFLLCAEFQIQKQHWQQDRSASKQGKVIIPGFKGVNYN